VPKRKPGQQGEGKYFADWVMDEVNDLVDTEDTEDSEQGSDIVVRTTLDLGMQRSAERNVLSLLDKEGVEKKVEQAALVTIGAGGAVRTMVGGRSYVDSPFNRAVQAKRQPGSSFKPFIYLDAYMNGMTPDTQVADAPIRVGKWSPSNYDGSYHGQVTLKEALALSLNAATVRVAQKLRLSEIRKLAKDLGITTPLANDLSLALGTSEVSLIDITSAYSVIAAGGEKITPYGVEQIRTKRGEVLYQHQQGEPHMVVDSDAVAQLDDSLQAVVNYGTGKAAALGGERVAGKTGTTQDYRDAWFVGYTGRLVTGVWMGNDDNTPMNKVAGGGLPARLWRTYMASASNSGDERNMGSQGYTARQLGNFEKFLGNLFGGSESAPAPSAPSAPEPGEPSAPPAPAPSPGIGVPGMTIEKPDSPIQDEE
jgi:penicillin-binding protein 1A